MRVRLPLRSDATGFVQALIGDADREIVVVVALDSRHRPTDYHIAHIGSLGASMVHPREVFKFAILANAASIIVAHNHPSGDPTPSNDDIAISKRLREAGDILGIEFLDHIIIGDEILSLKERGLI